MTVAVAVVGPRSGTIASDSLHVDVFSGRCSTVDKLVRARGWVASMAGISDVDDFQFLAALGVAMERSKQIDDVAGEFLAVAGAKLSYAYERLNTATGLTPDQFPTELLVVGAPTGVVEVGNVWSAYDGAHLTLHGNVSTARRDRAVCEAIGSHGPIERFTEQARHQAGLRHRVQDLPPPRNAETVAARLVEEVIATEPRLPRHPQWPVGAPLVAGPVQVESIRTRRWPRG